MVVVVVVVVVMVVVVVAVVVVATISLRQITATEPSQPHTPQYRLVLRSRDLQPLDNEHMSGVGRGGGSGDCYDAVRAVRRLRKLRSHTCVCVRVGVSGWVGGGG